MKSTAIINGIMTILMFISCEERDLTISIVPMELRPYYDRFYHEARLRGIRLRERPVEVIIDDELDVAGRSSRSKKTITIRASQLSYGHPRNAINLEYVIFHEMGHYVLGINHRLDTLENGDLASMMYPDKMAYTVNKEHLREFYLDELFGSSLNDQPFR